MRLITSLSYKFVSLLGSRSLVVGHTFTMTFKASSGRHETQIYTDYWYICNRSLPVKQFFFVYISFPLAKPRHLDPKCLVFDWSSSTDSGGWRPKAEKYLDGAQFWNFGLCVPCCHFLRLTGWPWKMMEHPKILEAQKNMDWKIHGGLVGEQMSFRISSGCFLGSMLIFRWRILLSKWNFWLREMS